ncbi:MAG: DUF1553 domain-containing protein, partial [Gemmataceae bacterium]
GYDPLYDHRALTDDLEARRFNRAAPDRSLMLLKPTGGVPHVGGVLWQVGEPGYELVKAWITQGVKLDLNASRVVNVEVFPKNPTIQSIGAKQQFAVVATYGDGRVRDVSAEAFLESSNTEVATVDKANLMTSLRRGESTMLARFEGAYAASTVIIMGDRSGFEWKAPAVQNRIDELVDTKLKRIKVQPSELSTDAEFLRRVNIDLTGLPPTVETVKAFLADTRPSAIKRAAVIDQLIGSESYIDNWSNKWADMLQVNRKFLGDPGATALRGWIRNAIAKNMPYDQFCYAVLTGSGSNVENPPAAYYKVLRDAESLMENTTQLFLAVRFNCNKCHDHPFEKWTQDQYYETAAYFTQVGRSEDPKFKGQKIGGSAVEGAQPLVEIIKDSTNGEIKHARLGTNTKPKFPYSHAELPPANLPRRTQMAKWITSPKNPLFAKSYVNRVWSYLIGVGIIEPVDDIRAGNPPTNPELLDYLTEQFVASGFDTRKLIKLITNSRTYQLSIVSNKWNKDDDMNFARGLPRRLPAEVLYDAVHAATGSITRLPGVAPGTRAAQLIDSNIDLPGGFLDLLGKPVRESACECERSNQMMLGPVLAFVSGPVVGDAVHDPNNRIAQFTLKEKDDARVVHEIYLNVLNRAPTAKEVTSGVAAIRGAAEEFKRIVDDHAQKRAVFEKYAASVPAKQAAWEQSLLGQKPANWKPILPTLAKSSGDKLRIEPFGFVLATGAPPNKVNYTIEGQIPATVPITGLRLEVFPHASLPARGPGRAPNGNFVLNELYIKSRPLDKLTGEQTTERLRGGNATFSQTDYTANFAIDGNSVTGWAVSPEFGKPQTAVFKVVDNKPKPAGQQLQIVMEQGYGGAHT